MTQNIPIRGQITLIRLQNFMTYDFIELKPGFNLNLIIGPNGTGKSSFVCAVMLAFGAKLKSIGRAENVRSFVKNGCEEAIIELELYEPFRENVTIARKIDVKGYSQYSINGKPANSAKIAELRNMYNIYLDNLCTFLPQEKVQDFSKLTPQQLLDQTQKAAGTEAMVNDYDHLKNLLREIRDKEANNGALAAEIDELQRKNDRIKDKVLAYIENKALCEKEILFRQKRAWLLYEEAVDELEELQSLEIKTKQALGGIQEEYRSVSKSVEELRDSLAETDNRLKLIGDERAEKIKQFRERVKILRESVKRLDNFEYFVELRFSEEEKKKMELKQHEENLDKLMNDLNNFMKKNGTDEELQARERKVNSEIESKQKEESDMMEKKATIEDELEQLKIDIKNISMEYRLLEKRRNFRLEFLKRYEPDVYKSVEWLKENKRIFQGPIFNPMLLELDITDVKYAKFIEARIPFRDMISFTCTNSDDLNLLVTKLRTEKRLRVNAICSEDGDIEQYIPELSLDEIRCYGFFIYMTDFIIGPPEIIRYLCKVYKIHAIPVGDLSVNNTCDKIPNELRLFFSDDHMFSIRVSEYSGEKAITVRRLKDPRIFTVLLNKQKIKEIIEREKQLVTKSGEQETKLKLAKHFLKNLNDKLEELRQGKRNVVTLISEKEQIENKVQRAENNIREIQITLKDPEAIEQELEEEREKLKTKINECLARVKVAISELGKLTVQPNEEQLRRDVIILNLEKFSKNKETVKQAVEKCKEELDSYSRRRMAKELECHTLKEDAKTLTDGISMEERNFRRFKEAFRTVKDTVAELEADLARIEVITEFIGGGDAELKEEYDERQNKIDEMTGSLSDSIQNLTKMREQFDCILQRWLIPVNDLVSRVNEMYGNFFQTMKCIGEVHLITGSNKDDIDKYGIEIRVKFRDGIPLHPLGRHFQSGGERAVATAVYLLSLQELVNVPFRFVDEINQGMDPVNEKRIMDLMISVTDRMESVQYFFITPKLLPDIQCSESMVVHSIYSGPSLLPSKLWNLDSYLNLNFKLK